MERIRTLIGRAAVTAVLAAAAVLSAQADVRIEETRALEPGRKLVVDADAGSVKVTGTSAGGARILVTSKDDDMAEKWDITYAEGAEGLTIEVRKKGKEGLLSWFSRTYANPPHFEIEVPERTELDLKTAGGHLEIARTQGDAMLRTSGGHLQISSLEGNLNATTSGGHIEVTQVTGDVSVGTSGGHIEVASVKGSLECESSGGHLAVRDVTGDIDASTSGGHIEIENAGGAVVAETSGGSVSVSFARGNARGGTIGSSGGGITVALDPAVSLTLDASSSGGNVTSDLEVKGGDRERRSSLRGDLGGGGSLLKIRTSAGPVRIKSLGSS